MEPKGTLATEFGPRSLPWEPAQKTALLINPPVYNVQYWAQWSQPYGLLRIARLLERMAYKRRELFPQVPCIVHAYIRRCVDLRGVHACDLGLQRCAQRIIDLLLAAICSQTDSPTDR